MHRIYLPKPDMLHKRDDKEALLAYFCWWPVYLDGILMTFYSILILKMYPVILRTTFVGCGKISWTLCLMVLGTGTNGCIFNEKNYLMVCIGESFRTRAKSEHMLLMKRAFGVLPNQFIYNVSIKHFKTCYFDR